MKPLFIVAAIAACVGLSGCNTVFGNGDNFKAFLGDLQTCDRDYTVAMGSGGSGLSGPSLNGSAHISCKAKEPAAASGDAIAVGGPATAPH